MRAEETVALPDVLVPRDPAADGQLQSARVGNRGSRRPHAGGNASPGIGHGEFQPLCVGIVTQLHQPALRGVGVLQHVVGNLVHRPLEDREIRTRKLGRRRENRVEDSIHDFALLVRRPEAARGQDRGGMPGGLGETSGCGQVSPVRVREETLQAPIRRANQRHIHIGFVVEPDACSEHRQHWAGKGRGCCGEVERHLGEASLGGLMDGCQHAPEGIEEQVSRDPNATPFPADVQVARIHGAGVKGGV